MSFFKKLFKAILIIIAIILIIIAIYFIWAYVAAAAGTVASSIGAWASGLSWAGTWAAIVGTNWGMIFAMAFVLQGFIKQGSKHNTSPEPTALGNPTPILTDASNVPGIVDVLVAPEQFGVYGMLMLYSTSLLHAKTQGMVLA